MNASQNSIQNFPIPYVSNLDSKNTHRKTPQITHITWYTNEQRSVISDKHTVRMFLNTVLKILEP